MTSLVTWNQFFLPTWLPTIWRWSQSKVLWSKFRSLLLADDRLNPPYGYDLHMLAISTLNVSCTKRWVNFPCLCIDNTLWMMPIDVKLISDVFISKYYTHSVQFYVRSKWDYIEICILWTAHVFRILSYFCFLDEFVTLR